MGIRQVFSRSRPAWRLAASLALALIALTILPSTALAKSPPGTPSSVSVTRADGTLTASWPAVSGATHYHVTYSSTGGASWELAALDHAATSITISVDNAKTYIVGARAKNKAGGGGWRNSPAAGPYTPPTPDPTPTPTPTPTPPGAVAAVSVTRDDGTLTASWDAPSGATSYHVTYTGDGAQSWQLAAIDHTSTSIVISADNTKTYIVGVRAKNAQGGSQWRNSPAAGPYTPPTPDPTPTPTPTPTPAPPDAVASVSVTRADGTLTAFWDAPSRATSYHVTYTDDNAQSWQLAALDHASTSIEIEADNEKTYIVGVRAKNSQRRQPVAKLPGVRAVHAAHADPHRGHRRLRHHPDRQLDTASGTTPRASPPAQAERASPAPSPSPAPGRSTARRRRSPASTPTPTTPSPPTATASAAARRSPPQRRRRRAAYPPTASPSAT